MSKLLSHFNLTSIAIATVSFVLFVLSFELNKQFDSYLLYAPGVSLLFIPAGVKLLGILVGRIPAVLGLYFASVYLSAGLWSKLDVGSYYYFAAISLLTYSAAVYVVLKGFNVSETLLNLRYSHVVVMSLLACLMNGVLHNLVYMTQGVTDHEELWVKSAAMSLGDFMGCFVVVASFKLALQLFRPNTGLSS